MPKIFNKNCKQCQKNYKGYGVDFCSHPCSIKWVRDNGKLPTFKGRKHSEASKLKMGQKGDKHPLFGTKLSKETIDKIRISRAGFRHTEESKRIMSKARIGKKLIWSKESLESFRKQKCGDKHPRWIKDRSKLQKSDSHLGSAYNEWRTNVYKRDGFKCRMENTDCSGKIEAHHILRYSEFPELRYEINNGITLCHKHHPRKKIDEEMLSPYFRELITKATTVGN